MPGIAADQIKNIHYILAVDDLDAKLNTASNGDIFILMEGTHTLSAQVDLSGLTDVTISGRGRSTVVNITYSGGPAFLLSGSDRCVFSNFQITGTQDQWVIQDTAATPSDNVLVDGIFDNRTVSTDTNGMLDFPATAARTGLTVMNCRSDTSFRGVSFIRMVHTGAGATTSGITILNNRISHGSTSGTLINITADTETIDDAIISGNYLGAGNVGISLSSVQRSNVSDNIIDDPNDDGITIAGSSSDCFVGSNSIFSPGAVGIEIQGSDYMCVYGNMIVSSTSDGISLDGTSDYAVVSANVLFTVSSGNGVSAAGDYVTISANVVVSVLTYGIHCTGATAVVSSNLITAAGTNAVHVTGTRALVSSNICYDPTSIGIFSNGGNGIFVGNMVYTPTGHGIDVQAYDDIVSTNSVYESSDYAYSTTNGRTQFSNNFLYNSTGGFECSNVRVLIASNMVVDTVRAIDGSDSTVVVGNHFHGMYDSNYAITLGDESCVVGNLLDISEYGTMVGVGSDAVVSSNWIRDAELGVYVDGSRCIVSMNTIGSCDAGISVTANGIESQIIGNLISTSGANGVLLAEQCHRVAVMSNMIISPTSHGILVQYTDTATLDVVISQNFIYNVGGSTQHGVYATGCTYLVCSENKIVTTTGDGINLDGCDYAQVNNNHVRNCTDSGISLDGTSDYAVVSGNIVDTISSGTGVSCAGTYVTITGNMVSDTSSYGIVTSGGRSTISGNLVYDVSSDGIRSSSSYVAFVGNYVYSPDGSGIICTSSRSITVGNLVDSPSGDCLEIQSGTATITGNLAIGGLKGIDVNSNGGTVSSNIMQTPGDLGIEGTGNQCVYVGNFVNNPSSDDAYLLNGSQLAIVGNFARAVRGGNRGFDIGATYSTIVGNHDYDADAESFHISGTNNIISSCYSYTGGADAIEVTGVNNTVIGCGVYDCTGNGIVLSATGCSAIGNWINTTSIDGISISAADCRASGNVIVSATGNGIEVAQNSDRCVITQNVISSPGAHAIYIVYTDTTTEDVLVSGNYIYNVGGSTQHGVYATGCTYLACNGNKIVTTTGDGIYLDNCDYSQVNSNHIRNCTDDGIYLDETDESMINDNRCYGNGGDGIQEDADCDNNLFDGNHLRGNTGTNFNQNGTNATTGTNKVA